MSPAEAILSGIARDMTDSQSTCGLLLQDRVHTTNDSFIIHGELQYMLNLCLEALLWCLTLLVARAVPVDRLLGSALVLLEMLDLVAVHVLDNVVSLPLLEAETKALV